MTTLSPSTAREIVAAMAGLDTVGPIARAD